MFGKVSFQFSDAKLLFRIHLVPPTPLPQAGLVFLHLSIVRVVEVLFISLKELLQIINYSTRTSTCLKLNRLVKAL